MNPFSTCLDSVLCLQITPDYSRILDPNYCLFEDDIDPCLKLITKQWPDVVTQDCHLIQRPEMFDVVMQYGTERYAQVLHMSEKHHWVSATNIGASYGTVKYFDSLNLAIPHSTKCAIASK